MIFINLFLSYSYNVSWVELLFGAIKTGVLNPSDKGQGKGNFKTIIEIILGKIKSIPKHKRILYYHHSLSHVMRFLLMHEL